jgi:hypothetical protein
MALDIAKRFMPMDGGGTGVWEALFGEGPSSQSGKLVRLIFFMSWSTASERDGIDPRTATYGIAMAFRASGDIKLISQKRASESQDGGIMNGRVWHAPKVWKRLFF